MKKEFSLNDLAVLVGGEIIGDETLVVNGLSPLDTAAEGDLSFLAKAGRADLLEKTSASAVLVPMEITESDKTLIRVKNPYLASAIIQNHILAEPFSADGIHESAVVGAGCSITKEITIGANAVIGNRVKIGERVFIGPGVVIGNEVVIGDDSVIRSNVTIEYGCELGARTIIHAGTVIGSDGYGYASDQNGYHIKRPQLGSVRIGDDVEIGANCCVDRATFGVTWIKSGTKIDNLVQVAHNVVIGENSLLVSQVGIAGSTTIGRNVVFGGKAGASGHITIGDGSMIAGKGTVHNDLAAGSMVAGTPAIPAKKWFKAVAVFGKIPDIVRDMRRIKKELRQISEQINKS